MQVAMHILKAGLSRYVAQARAGTVIEVTSHDKPIVRIIGIPAAHPPGLARLLASGAISGGDGKPAFLPAIRLSGDGKAVSDMVLEDRG